MTVIAVVLGTLASIALAPRRDGLIDPDELAVAVLAALPTERTELEELERLALRTR